MVLGVVIVVVLDIGVRLLSVTTSQRVNKAYRDSRGFPIPTTYTNRP
jgi:hypothetical protein